MPEIGLSDIAFHLHPDILAVAIGLPFALWYGIRRLGPLYAPQGEPAVTRRQIAWFTFGMVAFTLVEGWPIHLIGDTFIRDAIGVAVFAGPAGDVTVTGNIIGVAVEGGSGHQVQAHTILAIQQIRIIID